MTTLLTIVGILITVLGIFSAIACIGICGTLIYIFMKANKEKFTLFGDWFIMVLGEITFLGLAYLSIFSVILVIKSLINQ
jgi:sulfite exporter TauE/SafE